MKTLREYIDFVDSVQQDISEGLNPDKRARLDDLIEKYRDSTDPENYYSDDPDEVLDMIRAEFGDKIANQVGTGSYKMHFPRHGIQGHDALSWKEPTNRVTKAGKMYKQDSDYRKNAIKGRMALGSNHRML